MKISRIAISTLLALALTAGSAFADQGENGKHHDNERQNDRQAQGQHFNRGQHRGRYRHLQAGYLSDSQIAYAIHNRNSEIAQLRSMHSIDYSRVRIVRLTAAQKARLGIGMLPSASAVAYEPFTVSDQQSSQVAQIFNSNNQLVNILQNIVSGIVVQNAISNATGGSGGSAGSLANVLLNSGIPLSSLLGVFLGGNGILNAIVG
jgi:hypothetical protein